jgi:anti-sigma B factor antagonist
MAGRSAEGQVRPDREARGVTEMPAKGSLLQKEVKDAVSVLTFTTPNIDQSNVDDLLQEMTRELGAEGEARVLLDFCNVQYVSSIVLGNFVLFRRRVDDVGGKLKLCNLSPILHNLFRITKLDHLFTIEDDMETALQRF